MLKALYEQMIRALGASHASAEIVGAYRDYWNNTLAGRSRVFPCPACFMDGHKDSALKVQPAKGNTHYVKCLVCDATYSYVEEDL